MSLQRNVLALIIAAVFCSSLSASSMLHPPQTSGVVYQTWMRSGDMMQQVQTSNIDGFIGWEPITSKATLGGVATALAYSNAIWPHHPCCVLVVSDAGRTTLDRNAVLGMVWAHVKATHFINDPHNYNETVQAIETSASVNASTAQESLRHLTYTDAPSVQDAHDVYTVLDSASYLRTNVTTLGYASVDQFLDQFVQPDFYNEVIQRLSENPNWTPPKSNATITLGLLSGDSHKLAATMALNKGYYSSVGLHIVTKQYNNGVDLVQGFLSGEIEMGYCGMAPAMLKKINDGIQTTVIASVNSEGSALVVSPTANITTLSDLEGATIATPGAGTTQDVLLRKLAAQEGLRIQIG